MSSVVAGLAGAVIALLVASGFKNVQAIPDKKTGNTIFTATVDGKTQTIATLPKSLVTNAPFSNVFEVILRITTTSNVVDIKNPNETVVNPFNNADCLLLGIEAIFDSNFSAKGGFKIEINSDDIITDTTSSPALPNNTWIDAGAFTYDCRPQGKEFRKNDKMKIWATSSDGVTSVAITLTLTFALVDLQ